MAVLMLVCFYILSWEAAETAGRLIDVSGNIKADQVILVDAGHGGVDSGMVGIGGLKEKGINLDIAMKLKTILEKKGLAVVMTREEDKGLYENGTKNMKAQDLQNRIEQIRIYEPVLSVSIRYYVSAYTRTVIRIRQFTDLRYFIMKIRKAEKNWHLRSRKT